MSAVSATFPQSGSRLDVFRIARRRTAGSTGQVAAQAHPPDLIQLLSVDRWTRRGWVPPELRKALGVIQAHLSETRRLLGLVEAATPLRNASAVRELTSLLERDVAKLKIDGAWELAGTLKRLNLRFGNREYLASLLEYEQRRAEKAGRWHGWNAHFNADELRLLLNAFTLREPTLANHTRAVDRLNFLYLQREEAGRDRRARAALKKRFLTVLAPLLLLLLAGFGVAAQHAAHDNIWETLLLAACAGALGSTLSGIFKVRDQLERLDELRSFGPAMRVQPLIGACAGTILFLALQSHAISFGTTGTTGTTGWDRLGLLAFAAGFSEPFFLGIVQRVAVVSDRGAATAPKKS
jgi:hypothetical protein